MSLWQDDGWPRFRRRPAWYAEGVMSQGKAAEIAALMRSAFIDELARRKVPVVRKPRASCAGRSVADCLVGLVLRAKARGVIAQARPLVEQPRGAGLYMADDATATAMSLVNE